MDGDDCPAQTQWNKGAPDVDDAIAQRWGFVQVRARPFARIGKSFYVWFVQLRREETFD
jgi:hypothetical protein